MRGFRDDIVIATTFGFDLSDPRRVGVALDSRPDHIHEVTENSLRHLRTDHIDVLYQHPSTRTCRSRTWRARSAS
nr:hypothetical protein [Frankia gtarii]